MKTCCFSGPIIYSAAQKQLVAPLVQMQVRAMLKRGITTFACTNEPGFDEVAANAVFMLKKGNPKIRLIRYLSCDCEVWQADEIHCEGKSPNMRSSFKMFDESDVCIFCPGDLYAATSIPCMKERKLEIIDVMTGETL